MHFSLALVCIVYMRKKEGKKENSHLTLKYQSYCIFSVCVVNTIQSHLAEVLVQGFSSRFIRMNFSFVFILYCTNRV